MHEILLISISGNDRPGVTMRVTAVLAQAGARVLDLSQSVIHDRLELGLLVLVPPTAKAAPIVKEVLFAIHELGMEVNFTPISEDEYRSWVAEQGQQRHSVTLLGRGLSAQQISAATQVVSDQGLNIFAIQRLSGRVDLNADESNARSCFELLVRGTPHDGAAMRESLLQLSSSMGMDIAIQADDVYRRTRRLVCFDMDSTLIQAEVIDELAKAHGVGAQVAAITERAMAGEIDFASSFRERIALLRGLEAGVMTKIAEELPLTEGAERLCRVLRHLGYRLAIISGGFTFFGGFLKRRLGIDHVVANELEFADGRCTGRHLGELIDAQAKARHLQRICDLEGIRREQTIAVGDGANDLPMLAHAGLGIAFHAKPVVRTKASHAISTLGLDAILYMIGLRDWQLAAHDLA